MYQTIQKRFILWYLFMSMVGYAAEAVKTPTPQPATKPKEQIIPAKPIQCIVHPIPVNLTPNQNAPLKVIYMTSWVASSKKRREEIVSFVKKSEVNAIVIDVKDYSGHVSFATDDPIIEQVRTESARCKDLQCFIGQLHANGIYVIARIAVFQDPAYAKKYPTEAIQHKKGDIWVDFRGLPYIDPASEKFWGYIVQLSKACKAIGFDEVNFDYIRFPTDGQLREMVFPYAASKMKAFPEKQIVRFVRATGDANQQDAEATIPAQKEDFRVEISPKVQILNAFYQHLYQKVRKEMDIPISADLFGLVLTARSDLNIGQVLEMTAPYFDYIGPMIYPSHYSKGFKNIAQPATRPYEVVLHVLQEGVRRLKAIGQSPHKLRPWLQDFHLGARYDAAKLHAQKKGVRDAGLDSWFIWNPSNRYALEKYVPEASAP